jgi:hypothetical protein
MALSQALRGLISQGSAVLGQQGLAAVGCGAASVLQQKRAASSHAENTNTFLREVRHCQCRATSAPKVKSFF